MKEKLKEWMKENWHIVLCVVMFSIACAIVIGCGSTWEIKGNKTEIIIDKKNKQNDTTRIKQMESLQKMCDSITSECQEINQ